MAISARNAISMARDVQRQVQPVARARAAASMTLTAVFSTLISTLPAVAGLSDFGHQDLGQHDGGRRGHDHRRQQVPDLDVRHQ